MKKTNSLRAVAYIRVSTDEQDLGPEAQLQAIKRYAEAHGLEIAASFEDRISGGADVDKRPGLLAALDALRSEKAGVLLVAKRDRIARDTFVAAMVERLAEKAGATVQSADGVGNGNGPEAQLLRGIVDVFAQYERAMIRARTKAALAVKKRKGERVGSIPYGWKLAEDGIQLEVETTEQRVMELAHELRAEGLSLRAIGAALEESGVLPPRRSKQWHPETVKALLASEAA